MSTTLYAVPVSNFSATIRLALAIKNVPFTERLPPGGYGSAAYKAIVPIGIVPALVDDAVTLSESAVILEYLEERYPSPPLLPAGPPQARARVRWLQRLHDTRIEPPLRALFAQMDPRLRVPSAVSAEWARLDQRLRDLAQACAAAPFLAGERLSLADIAYPATLRLGELMAAELGRALTLPAPLAAWWQMLRAEASVAAMLAAYEPAVEDWLAAKCGGG